MPKKIVKNDKEQNSEIAQKRASRVILARLSRGVYYLEGEISTVPAGAVKVRSPPSSVAVKVPML